MAAALGGGFGGGVFAAAAGAARAAAELEREAHRGSGGGSPSGRQADAVPSPRAAAEARLAAALEVNRALGAALAERKRLLRESAEEASLLQARLAGRAVEEPVRKARLEELQGRLQAAEPAGPRAARDAALLGRETAGLESKILALNEKNLQLADKHRQERVQLTEKQNKLRILGKRERELAKQLDFIAGKLTEASLAASQTGGSVPIDFKNLPGLCLSKLVGRLVQRDPPPAPAAAKPVDQDAESLRGSAAAMDGRSQH